MLKRLLPVRARVPHPRVVAAAAVFAIVAGSPLGAAVVLEPAFEELVRDARQILVTQVVSTRASWRSSPDGPFIETTVRFRVDSVVKGAFVRERSLSFLGGRIGDVSLEVSDMVEFRTGDRDVLFIEDAGNAASPLVGFNHGRFRVGRNDGVLTHDGQAFSMDVRGGRSSQLLAAPMEQAVSVNNFIAHIRATASAAGISLR